MKSIEEPLRYFVNELLKKHGSDIVKVILFGSYAKGYVDEYSDVDVVVVHKGDAKEVIDSVAEAAFETSLKFDLPIEPGNDASRVQR